MDDRNPRNRRKGRIPGGVSGVRQRYVQDVSERVSPENDNVVLPAGERESVFQGDAKKLITELGLGVLTEDALRDNLDGLTRAFRSQVSDYRHRSSAGVLTEEDRDRMGLFQRVSQEFSSRYPHMFVAADRGSPHEDTTRSFFQTSQAIERLSQGPRSTRDEITQSHRGLINRTRAVRQIGQGFDDETLKNIEEALSSSTDHLTGLAEQAYDKPNDTDLQRRLSSARVTTASLQRLHKAGQPEEREIDPLLGHRSAAMRARTRLQGGESLSDQQVVDFQKLSTELRSSSMEFVEQADKLAAEGGDTSEIHRLSSMGASRSKLAKELENILKSNAEEQGKTTEKATGALVKVASALAIGSIVNRAMFTDPLQYGYMPAMNVMSKTGELGGVMGRAMGSSEEYQTARRQEMFGGGVGGLFAGAAMGGRAGLGVGLAGALAMIGGGTGLGPKFLAGLGLQKSEQELRELSVAQDLVDPARLSQHHQMTTPGLMQLGYGADDGVGSDSVIPGMYDDRLHSLGVDDEHMGAFLSRAASSVMLDRDNVEDIANYSHMARMFGMSEDNMLGLMGSAQRAGSSDVVGSVLTMAGATADEDGDISNYNMNVLVPALMQVTESLSLRNVARSNEDLEKQVSGLYRTLSTGDSTFANLMRSSPEAFSRVATGLDSDVGGLLDDPALFAFAQKLGISPSDIINKNPEVARTMTTALMSGRGISLDMLSDPGALADMDMGTFSMLTSIGRALLPGATGGDPQQIISLLHQFMSGGNLTKSGTNLRGVAEDAFDGRLGDLTEEDLAELTAKTVQQANTVFSTMGNLVPQITKMQTTITESIAAADLESLAMSGIESILKELRKALGIRERNAGMELEGRRGFTSRDGAPISLTEGSLLLQERDESGELRDNVTGELIVPEGSIVPEERGFATGGYTGGGGRTDTVGYVHGGEFVINDNNVSKGTNRSVLERMNAGEDVSIGRGVSGSSISGDGARTRLVMDISGMTTEEVNRVAYNAAAKYANDMKLHYR